MSYSTMDVALSEVRTRYDAWNSRLSKLNSDIEDLQWRLDFSKDQSSRRLSSSWEPVQSSARTIFPAQESATGSMLKFLKEPPSISKKENIEAEFSHSWFNEYKEEENSNLQSVKQKTVRFTSTDPEVSDKSTFTTAERSVSTGISSPPTPACGQSLLSHSEPEDSPQHPSYSRAPTKQPERLAQLPYPYKDADKSEQDTDYLSDFTNLKFVRLPGEEEEPKDELKNCETVTENLREERSPQKEQVLKQQIRHLQEELGTIKGYISEKMQKQTEARQVLQSEIAELIRHSEKVQTENTTYRQLLGIDGRYKSL